MSRASSRRRRHRQIALGALAVASLVLAGGVVVELTRSDPTSTSARSPTSTRPTEVPDTAPRSPTTPTTSASPGDYENPVITPDAPDPYILKVGDTYYAYSTNTGFLHIPVYTSTDLATWSSASDALPGTASWIDGTFFYWAPGVLHVDDQYLMYYAVQDQGSENQMCISVASAQTPAGPFVDSSTGPLVCQTTLGGSIDPAPFVDADGTRWLIWKSDGDSPTCGCPSSLWSQQLGADGTSLEGDPNLLLTVAEPWEQPLIEGPQLQRAGNAYYLLYSANWWNTPSYAIGIARCSNPSGPCTRVSVDGPFVGSAGAASGPGGPVTFAAEGALWIGYHAWTTGAVATPGAGRAMRIDRLELPDEGSPSTDAPTTAREPL